MAALSRAVVNTDAMQVVRHSLQSGILVVKQTLLSSDLLFKALDLSCYLGAVRIKHLLEEVGLDWVLTKRQVHLNVSHVVPLECGFRDLLLTLCLEEVEALVENTGDGNVRSVKVCILCQAVFEE